MAHESSYIAIVDDIFDPEEAQSSEAPFGKRWGGQLVQLKQEHLQALQQGKLLAIDDQGEYVVYLQLEGQNHV
jgi:hypothetical protein